MENIQTNQTLGEIVAIIPKAGDIFKKYRIDFCCGGSRPLSEAIREQNLNEREILDQLNKAHAEAEVFKGLKDFRNMSPTQLIDYIENTHHAFTRSILPRTSESLTAVLRAHGANHNELFRVHKLFHVLKTDLEQHLIKEEEILLPLIREYDRNPSPGQLDQVRKVMQETEDEHDAAGKILKELRQLTKDYEVPSDACQTYKLTFDRIQELESDLFQHIHLENNILFRNFRMDQERLKM